MSNKILIAYSDVLLYEYRILRFTYERLYDYKTTKMFAVDPYLVPVFESWVVHFRCLYYFLNPKMHDKRDINLKDFLTDDKIKILNTEFEKWKDRDIWKKKADKQLAHITKDRLQYNASYKSKRWNFGMVSQRIFTLFYKFLELADNNDLCQDLIDIKNTGDDPKPLIDLYVGS